MAKKKKKHNKTPKDPVRFSLLAKQPDRSWKASQKLGYFLWNIAWLLLACAVLAVATLLLSAANFGMEVFGGYFEKPMIVIVNTLLPFAFALVMYLLIGRAWIAYAVTSVLALAIALGNYFLIAIRNDPLKFIDILCLREALDITATQHYELHFGWEVFAAVLLCAVMCAELVFLARWTPKFKNRFGLLGAAVCAIGITGYALNNNAVVNKLMRNYDHINTWSSTQVYISRGVLFSFVNSIPSAFNTPPANYDEGQVEQLLAQYPETPVPEDKKVNFIVIMRESYSDLSTLESTPGAIDFSCYDYYHSLAAESYTGKLITNGFGGNTKDAERCFLTGSYAPIEYRKPANSYVWYLREQGYTVEGAHPFNGWFYNRANVNSYLGFETYNFREQTFDALVGEDVIAEDDVLFEEIWRMFEQSDPDKPYFNFSVTYEGHGPYKYKQNSYSTRFVKENTNSADGYAMNNYLSCVYKRDQELSVLVEHLRSTDRPVVLMIYGDHKPTLGSDINNYTTAAYQTYGMDMDVASEKGFVDYYGTEYLIWANDAAKAQLGIDLAGKTGPMISPCYLMNVLTDAVGWDCGSSYLQAMGDFMEQFPVVSAKGRVSINGKLSQTIPAEQTEAYHSFLFTDYYQKTKGK